MQVRQKPTPHKLLFRPTDLYIFLLALFWIISYYFSGSSQGHIGFTFLVASIAYYVCFRSFKDVDKTDSFRCLAFIIPGVLQSLFVFAQYFDLVNSFGTFELSGTFINPGPLGIYLGICLLPSLYQTIKTSHPNIRNILFICSGVISLALLSSFSRTAYIALLFSFPFVFWPWEKLRKFLLPGIAMLLLAGATLWMLKPDSAQGRIYHYWISIQALTENPLTGSGAGQFARVYNDYQRQFFYDQPDSRFASLADDHGISFNAFLQIGIEYGMIGLVLVLGAVFTVFQNNAGKSLLPSRRLHVAMLSFILLAGMSSYTFSIPVIWLSFLWALTILSEDQRVIFRIPLSASLLWLFSGLAIVVFLLLLFLGGRQLTNAKAWEQNTESINDQNRTENLTLYEGWYSHLKAYPSFLYNYAFELSEARELEKSNLLLMQANKAGLNNMDLHLRLGYNYYQMGLYDRALIHFQYARHLTPVRLSPRYWLVKTFEAQGKKDMATSEARDLLNLEVKVSSFKADYIRNEIRKYLIESGSVLK
ncbi:O-antigen ligase family protein [Fulvivirgaceae bacterium BMA10]|uniref:O-antigen ligase family protein n=1 Tax=Splendidivirga corallicola TaxID=3051826 RepID=A0ABT8KMN9_9BACT|nr:O-antigen ligase family protein [Fulvivirgaceae bacterium BMA10]